MHDDEEDEDEDDYEITQYLEDRGQFYLDVLTREIVPPMAVAVQLVHVLVMEDENRHSNIEEAGSPPGFLGRRLRSLDPNLPRRLGFRARLKLCNRLDSSFVIGSTQAL